MNALSAGYTERKRGIGSYVRALALIQFARRRFPYEFQKK